MENGEKQSKKKRKKEKAVGEKERSKEKKDESKGNREKGEERESGNVNVLFSFLFVTSTDRKRAGISCFPGSTFGQSLDKIDVIAVWLAKLRQLDGIRLTEGTTMTTAHRYQCAVTIIKLNLDGLETASLSL